MKKAFLGLAGLLILTTSVPDQSALGQSIDKVDIDIVMQGNDEALFARQFSVTMSRTGVKDETGVDCSVAPELCELILEVAEEIVEDPENGGAGGGGGDGNESGGEQPEDDDDENDNESAYRVDESAARGNTEHLKVIRMFNSAASVSVNFWTKDGGSKTKMNWGNARKKRVLRKLIRSLKEE